MENTNITLILIAIVLLIYVLSRLLPMKEKRKNLTFLILTFVALYIVLFIRKPVSDMGNYFDYFKFLNSASWEQFWKCGLEPGYKILNFLVGRFTSDEMIFMHIVDILSLIGIFWCIKRYSKNYLLAVLLYISLGTFSMNFFILRQAIAISILAFSIKYIDEKKPIKFILATLLAVSFHDTSVIFLIAYPLCNIKVNQLYVMLISFAGVIVALFSSMIVKLMGPILAASGYVDIVAGEGYGKLISLILLMIGLLMASGYLRSKNEIHLSIRKEDDKTDIFVVLSFLSIILQLIATQGSVLARASGGFMIGFVIFASNSSMLLKNKETKAVMNVVVAGICILYAIFTEGITLYSIM